MKIAKGILAGTAALAFALSQPAIAQDGGGDGKAWLGVGFLVVIGGALALGTDNDDDVDAVISP